MSSQHNRHGRIFDTYEQHQPRALNYVPDPETVAVSRRRMQQQQESPALPPAAFQVGRREQMPPPPPPKDDHPQWPTRKSSRDALKPLDYKRSSTASTWGRNLASEIENVEAPPLPHMGEIPIIYRREPHDVDRDAEEERARRRELRRRDRKHVLEQAAVVRPGTAAFLRPTLVHISKSRSRSPPVFKHQQRQEE
ncbi:hypothetical protein NBRC10513v2_004353 [Rhodotorula toruloides]